MYKNGYYVEKDIQKYREIIENLYKDFYHTTDNWNDASLSIRLAEIRFMDGKTDEAIKLLFDAKESMKQCISVHASFKSYSHMQRIINHLYELKPLDTSKMDFYDFYEILKNPAKASFNYCGRKYNIESTEEDDGSVSVCLDGIRYRSVNDMMMNAKVDGELISQDPLRVKDIEVL